MREIFFRGKIQGLTDWSYGYFAKAGVNNFILFDTESEDNYSLVDESTVGQYTGLRDKAGKRIFEGDVVSVSGIANAEIIYNDSEACFAFNYGVEGKPFILTLCSDNWLEVIGNIHDNPELLRGEE